METEIIEKVAAPAEAKKEKFSIENFEGLHIIVWLIKDFCWCLKFKNVGVFMIVPTFLMSLFFVYKTRDNLNQFFTNISVTFWITANSLWMLSEFFQFEDATIYSFPIKYLYGGLFAMGVLNLLLYYTYRFVFKR